MCFNKNSESSRGKTRRNGTAVVNHSGRPSHRVWGGKKTLPPHTQTPWGEFRQQSSEACANENIGLTYRPLRDNGTERLGVVLEPGSRGPCPNGSRLRATNLRDGNEKKTKNK